jgi:hypothetical protein
MAISFDIGTYNLVCCTRDASGEFQLKREINAFVEIKLTDRFLFNVIKSFKGENGQQIPVVEREDVAYILGEAAVKTAYTMPELQLRRPMSEGCVNPKEKDAFEIMNIMIHGLLDGNVKHDKELLYYSVPANAVNQETDADYHSQILKAIFDAYESDEGHKVIANPINEGLALVYAELMSKNCTGLGVSFGSGMVNVCFAMYGVPAFQFSIANSGDWIDKQAAKATGESPTFINQEKMKISLSDQPKTLVERAIQTQYRIMIEKTVQGIKKGIVDSGKKARTDHGIDIVIAGGTSLPNGFDSLFKEVITQAKLPIEIGSIVRPPDPLYSVAKGVLIAAEAAAK